MPTGARIPVDGGLISTSALIEGAFLPGESAAVEILEDALFLAGEINVASPLPMCASAVGDNTILRRMARMVETAENSLNSYTALADKEAQIYAPTVHLLALLAFVGWVAADGGIRHALNVAIVVLIITCACALGLAVPAVSTAAISRLFSMGYLVKHATALECLADVSCVVFDKTGTLSQPSVTLPEGITPKEKAVAKALAQASNHPLSHALVDALSGVRAIPICEITEVVGRSVISKWKGMTVRLGRGAWLGTDIDDLGLQFGDAQPLQTQASKTPRTGVCSVVRGLAQPFEIVTRDAIAPATRFANYLGLPSTANVRPVEKLR